MFALQGGAGQFTHCFTVGGSKYTYIFRIISRNFLYGNVYRLFLHQFTGIFLKNKKKTEIIW